VARLIVTEKRHDEFVEVLSTAFSAKVVGEALAARTARKASVLTRRPKP
jgi:acyl-CoA reductase-like NAD-dependent aldehyde dehydrogenase